MTWKIVKGSVHGSRITINAFSNPYIGGIGEGHAVVLTENRSKIESMNVVSLVTANDLSGINDRAIREENGVLTEVGTPFLMNKMNITFLSTISFSYLPSER